MIDEKQIIKQMKQQWIEFGKLKHHVQEIAATFPKHWPHNYRCQKCNELISLLRTLNSLSTKDWIIEKIDFEEPDFLLRIAGEIVGVEILDYRPSESEMKNMRHWNRLCDRLATEYLQDIVDSPQCYEIRIKDLTVKGCKYDDFKKDFQLWLLERNGINTKYIDNIQYHRETQTFAYINQGAYWLHSINMDHLVSYIHAKKNDKVATYQKNINSVNIWLIVKVEFDSEIDIEDAPVDFIRESPFTKIFLVKGHIVKQIWNK